MPKNTIAEINVIIFFANLLKNRDLQVSPIKHFTFL